MNGEDIEVECEKWKEVSQDDTKSPNMNTGRLMLLKMSVREEISSSIKFRRELLSIEEENRTNRWLKIWIWPSG